MMKRRGLAAALLVHLALAAACLARGTAAPGGGAGDNWAVIVGASRFWLNYRHTANALAVYQAVRRLGIPDSNIILMLADSVACNPRNARPGHVATGGGPGAAARLAASSLLSPDVAVDYRGRDVSVDSILSILTGRHAPGTPAAKRLGSGPGSNVLLYLTGHGGDQFLKLHDSEELLAADVATALRQMHAAGRYKELLLMLDTCQASTMYSLVDVPGVIGIGSSKLGESSYAHNFDARLGVHLVDEFTLSLERFLGVLPARGANATLQQLLDYATGQRLSSELDARTDLVGRSLAQIQVADFFGGSGGGSRKEQAKATERRPSSGSEGGGAQQACRSPPVREARGSETMEQLLLSAGAS